MPTNKQRRQAAQRRLQRQLERREQLARKRKRNLLVVLTVLAVLVVAGGISLAAGAFGGSDKNTTAAASPTSSGSTCQFSAAGTANSNLKDVGTPSGDVPTSGTTTLTMATNVGDIGLTLDHKAAPCAAASFVYLTKKNFFNGTICHRETDSEGLKVLQCGDPSGTGSGGPTYQYPTHVTGKETYQRGTVAMANSGQGYDGSQFFLVYGDSKLSPDYTVVGSIDQAGLAVLDKIAANGNDGSNGAGDGKPKQTVTITSMTIASSTVPSSGAPASAPAASNSAPQSSSTPGASSAPQSSSTP